MAVIRKITDDTSENSDCSRFSRGRKLRPLKRVEFSNQGRSRNAKRAAAMDGRASQATG